MRTSCNACRVLRKGCSDNCSLRPCLHWIQSSDSQSNATLFLAKFYGRAGLLNLINAGPQHLRPAIFRSLLYEACGRIIDPVSGSVGLLWSGNWDKCQAAVDSVLSGSTLEPLDGSTVAQPVKGCDIRHLTRGSNEIQWVQTRTRFKRSAGRGRAKSRLGSVDEVTAGPTRFTISGWAGNYHPGEANVDPSHDSSTLLFSAETVEASLANRVVKKYERQVEESEVELELCLGCNQVLRDHLPTVEEQQTVIDVFDDDDA